MKGFSCFCVFLNVCVPGHLAARAVGRGADRAAVHQGHLRLGRVLPLQERLSQADGRKGEEEDLPVCYHHRKSGGRHHEEGGLGYGKELTGLSVCGRVAGRPISRTRSSAHSRRQPKAEVRSRSLHRVRLAHFFLLSSPGLLSISSRCPPPDLYKRRLTRAGPRLDVEQPRNISLLISHSYYISY